MGTVGWIVGGLLILAAYEAVARWSRRPLQGDEDLREHVRLLNDETE